MVWLHKYFISVLEYELPVSCIARFTHTENVPGTHLLLLDVSEEFLARLLS